MRSALVTGTFGTLLTYWLGTRFLGFSGSEIAFAILAANVAGFFSLPGTLFLERRPRIRRVLLGNALKTWAFLALLFLALLFAFDWQLAARPGATLILYWPFVLCCGLMLPIMGPFQDAIIRWEYRRERSRSARRGQANSIDFFPNSGADTVRIQP